MSSDNISEPASVSSSSGDQKTPTDHRSAKDDLPRADIADLKRILVQPLALRSFAITGLFLIALIAALRLAEELLIPITLAVLISFLLSPIVSGLQRLRIPIGLASGLVVLGSLAAVGGGLYFLAQPVSEWADRLPTTLRQLEQKIRPLQKPLEELAETGDQIDRMRQLGSSKPKTTTGAEKPSFVDLALSQTGAFFTGTAISTVLLFFLLASGDHFIRKLVQVQPRLRSAVRSVEVVRRLRAEISGYLSTVAWINLLLGIAVGLTMYLLDMPSPVLWGVMAACLNFIPFLGALVGIAVVTVVAIASFETLGSTIIPPLAYFFLTSLEANLVTPFFLSRRLTLSPVVIFLGLIFWSWLWGVAGALLAVPILVTVKIICDAVEALRPIGELMGR